MPYHHGDLAEELKAALIRLVERGSIEAVTMRAVAREARVSHAAPSHHFANLDDLLGAIAVDGFKALAARVVEEQRACGDEAWARLRAYGLAYIAYAIENPAQFRIMFRHTSSDRPAASQDLKHRSGEAAMDTLIACIKACLPKAQPNTSDASHLALLAWSVVHGSAMLLLDGPLEMVARQRGISHEGPGAAIVDSFVELLKSKLS